VQSSGRPEIVAIGLIDGPAAKRHPDPVGRGVRRLSGTNGDVRAQPSSPARRYGTTVNWTLLVRLAFLATVTGSELLPGAMA
jgi:hypothetical protein